MTKTVEVRLQPPDEIYMAQLNYTWLSFRSEHPALIP